MVITCSFNINWGLLFNSFFLILSVARERVWSVSMAGIVHNRSFFAWLNKSSCKRGLPWTGWCIGWSHGCPFRQSLSRRASTSPSLPEWTTVFCPLSGNHLLLTKPKFSAISRKGSRFFILLSPACSSHMSWFFKCRRTLYHLLNISDYQIGIIL